MTYKIIFLGFCFGCVAFAGTNGFKPEEIPTRPGSYRLAPDGEYYIETNIAELWPGKWKDGTNGFRVQVYWWQTNAADSNPWLSVGVGSEVRNSGSGYFSPPDLKFEKFELRSSKGVIVPTLKGVSMVALHPSRVSKDVMPRVSWNRWQLRDSIGFLTNSPPWTLRRFRIGDVYRIDQEDDYMLTVCPVMYLYTGKDEFLDRIGLPCVSAKIHLLPTQGKR